MLLSTIREAYVGKAKLRLLKTGNGFKVATIIGGKVTTIEGSDPDQLWAQASAHIGRSAPGFWGYEDAKARFIANFPQGFEDSGYIAGEREYKEAASRFIAQNVPLEAAHSPTPAVCENALRAFAKTNMATPIEKTRLQALLRSDQGPRYLAAVAELADGGAKTALPRLDALMREHGQPSWPGATYLPFFWRPHDAMFLKPQVTKDFAERVGHRFVRDYDARLNADTYASLLDLASECGREIASLAPKDRIDVQSFIWVVGDYPDPRL